MRLASVTIEEMIDVLPQAEGAGVEIRAPEIEPGGPVRQ